MGPNFACCKKGWSNLRPDIAKSLHAWYAYIATLQTLWNIWQSMTRSPFPICWLIERSGLESRFFVNKIKVHVPRKIEEGRRRTGNGKIYRDLERLRLMKAGGNKKWKANFKYLHFLLRGREANGLEKCSNCSRSNRWKGNKTLGRIRMLNNLRVERGSVDW